MQTPSESSSSVGRGKSREAAEWVLEQTRLSKKSRARNPLIKRNDSGINKNAILAIAAKAGATKGVDDAGINFIRNHFKKYLATVIGAAIVHMESQGRTAVSEIDVDAGLRKLGLTEVFE